MDCSEILFSRHALTRMFERGLTKQDLQIVLQQGETIHSYPDDQPYPSRLLLQVVNGRPIHAVVAFDAAVQRCILVTAYIPDPTLWTEDFRRRRSP